MHLDKRQRDLVLKALAAYCSHMRLRWNVALDKDALNAISGQIDEALELRKTILLEDKPCVSQ